MIVFHILNGSRLEIFLLVLAALFLWYSTDAHDLLRRVSALRPAIDQRNAERAAKLKTIHNNAYTLILMIADRFTRNLIHWSLVSVAVIVLYDLGDYFQIQVMASEHVTHMALAAVYGAPILGVILSLFWTRRLVLELSDLEKAVLQAPDGRLAPPNI